MAHRQKGWARIMIIEYMEALMYIRYRTLLRTNTTSFNLDSVPQNDPLTPSHVDMKNLP